MPAFLGNYTLFNMWLWLFVRAGSVIQYTVTLNNNVVYCFPIVILEIHRISWIGSFAIHKKIWIPCDLRCHNGFSFTKDQISKSDHCPRVLLFDPDCGKHGFSLLWCHGGWLTKDL